MSHADPIATRYLRADYLRENPSWNNRDFPWETNKVCKLLENHAIVLDSVIDVGCSVDFLLVEPQKNRPSAHIAYCATTTTGEHLQAKSCVLSTEFLIYDFPVPVTSLFPEQQNPRSYVLKRGSNCTR